MAPKRKRNTVQALPVLDGKEAQRASPSDGVAIPGTSDAETAETAYEPSGEDEDEFVPEVKIGKRGKAKAKAPPKKQKDAAKNDPGEENVPLVRPPAFNSSYVPIPFKGRIGYVCIIPQALPPACVRADGEIKRLASTPTCAPAFRPYSALVLAASTPFSSKAHGPHLASPTCSRSDCRTRGT
jgi:hypothetical protein